MGMRQRRRQKRIKERKLLDLLQMKRDPRSTGTMYGASPDKGTIKGSLKLNPNYGPKFIRPKSIIIDDLK